MGSEPGVVGRRSGLEWTVEGERDDVEVGEDPARDRDEDLLDDLPQHVKRK